MLFNISLNTYWRKEIWLMKSWKSQNPWYWLKATKGVFRWQIDAIFVANHSVLSLWKRRIITMWCLAITIGELHIKRAIFNISPKKQKVKQSNLHLNATSLFLWSFTISGKTVKKQCSALLTIWRNICHSLCWQPEIHWFSSVFRCFTGDTCGKYERRCK